MLVEERTRKSFHQNLSLFAGLQQLHFSESDNLPKMILRPLSSHASPTRNHRPQFRGDRAVLVLVVAGEPVIGILHRGGNREVVLRQGEEDSIRFAHQLSSSFNIFRKPLRLDVLVKDGEADDVDPAEVKARIPGLVDGSR